MASDLRIEKKPLAVALAFLDAPGIVGTVYLAGNSQHHTGPEAIEELLEESKFIPCVVDGKFLLIGTATVKWLSVDARIYREFLGRREHVLAATLQQKVELHLRGSEALEGRIMLQHWSANPRLSDSLNRLSRFVRFDTGERLYFVNTATIMTLAELGPLEPVGSHEAFVENGV